MAPLTVLVFAASATLRSAPPLDTPVPDSVNGSATVIPEAPVVSIRSVAPESTVVPVEAAPSALASVTDRVPALTVVDPVYELDAVSVSVLVDDVVFETAPAPLMTPLIV